MGERQIIRVLSRLAGHPVPEDVRTSPLGVTIAIPNWNHEYVLPRSISSALTAVRSLRSRHIDAEVLVIDDFSRDGSLPLLRQLEALHFGAGLRVAAFAENRGLPVARNYALIQARYRYIAFMDADNELIPDNLYEFYRAICETHAAVVYGSLLVQTGTDGEMRLLNNESFQDRMFELSYIDAFAIVDRLQLLDCGGYATDVELHGCEDWELYLHLAACGRRLVFVPLVFGIYYELAGSMLKQLKERPTDLDQYMRRSFNQVGLREALPLNTRHLRYHPDIGYI